MAILSLLSLYLNVPTKSFVSVNGSPISIPAQYYGDKPTFQIIPVMAATTNTTAQGFGAQAYQPYVLTGYTADMVMAGAPNAESPPTPFAFQDGLTYIVPGSGFPYFQGTLDLTQPVVGEYIGNSSGAQAYFNFGCIDATADRTTLFQGTFLLNASIDTVAVGPPQPTQQYLTAAQIAALYVAIGPVPGKYIVFESPDGTKKRVLSLDNNGNELFQPA